MTAIPVQVTTSFEQIPVPYCTRCGVADARVTHICPPLLGMYPPDQRTSWSLDADTLSSLSQTSAARPLNQGGETDEPGN